MRFEVGKKYHDAVGRRWKVRVIETLEDNQEVMIVQRFLTICIAATMTEDNSKAIVLIPKGFTTIYADDPPYKRVRE